MGSGLLPKKSPHRCIPAAPVIILIHHAWHTCSSYSNSSLWSAALCTNQSILSTSSSRMPSTSFAAKKSFGHPRTSKPAIKISKGQRHYQMQVSKISSMYRHAWNYFSSFNTFTFLQSNQTQIPVVCNMCSLPRRARELLFDEMSRWPLSAHQSPACICCKQVHQRSCHTYPLAETLISAHFEKLKS